MAMPRTVTIQTASHISICGTLLHRDSDGRAVVELDGRRHVGTLIEPLSRSLQSDTAAAARPANV